MNWNEMLDEVSKVTYKDWLFLVTIDGPRPILQIYIPEIDMRSRKWLLSGHMTKGELIATCLKAVLTAEEHEAREKFLYKNKAVYGPHIDLDALYETCEKVTIRS